MIRLENIHVTFLKGTPLERPALRGLNLTLDNGSFATIIGSNGAGKSTLLNVLTGSISPDEGRVFIDDQDATTWSLKRRSQAIARVFQDPLDATCAPLTIAENLALSLGRGHGFGLFKRDMTAGKRALFKEALKELGMGLEDRLDQPMGLLSGGQRQAVSLIMAVMSPLSILILDEHTAALDPKSAKQIIHHTQELVKKKKLTTLMVTHSLHQALEVGNRTLMLHKGTIAHDFNEEERRHLSSQDLLTFFEEMDR